MRKKWSRIWATVAAVCYIGSASCSDDETTEPTTQESETQTCVLNELEIYVNVDESFTLQVLGNDLGLPVEWSSANANVATVQDGEVVGVAPGTTDVTAEVGEQTLTCEVTVAFAYENAVYIALENEVETAGGYALQLLKGSSYTLSPALIDGEKVENVTFTYASESAALNVQGATITAVSETERAEVTIVCVYEGETYRLTVYVTVAE